MRFTRLADATPYTPPMHEHVRSYRLQGGENSATAFCSVGLSYYAPGGSAEMSASPREKIYVVLGGELAISLPSGENVILRQFDSCVIAANESREIRNNADVEAILLVMMPTADSTASQGAST